MHENNEVLETFLPFWVMGKERERERNERELRADALARTIHDATSSVIEIGTIRESMIRDAEERHGSD